MSELKYIVVSAETKHGKTVVFPVIFGHYISHKDMAAHVQSMLRRGQFHLDGSAVVSAGFTDIDKATARGHSESLDIKSRPEDADIINAFRMDWSTP